MRSSRTQAIQIDPALLAYFPSASRKSAAFDTFTPPSTSPAEYTRQFKVGVGYSAGASTIGVGYDAATRPCPTLSVSSVTVGQGLAIDPALFELEAVVKSVRASIADGTALRFASGSTSAERKSKLKRKHSRPVLASSHTAGQSTTFIPHNLAQVDMGTIDPEIDPSLQVGGIADAGTGLGEEFDPTIREIVKSLTKAQENQPQAHAGDMGIPTDADTNSALSQALVDEQTVAAISAHLVAAQGMEQDLQNGLGAMTSDQLDSFFHHPSSPHYLLSDYADAQQHASTSHIHQLPLGQTDLDMQITSALQSEAFNASTNAVASSSAALPDEELENADDSDPNTGAKRKRGRPKGSKNKSKQDGSPSVPKPRKPRAKPDRPPQRVGRPLKERTGAELEEYLRKQAEAAAGVKRQRGRPRKFPGYLVRDMRLKANREEFREVVMRHADGTETREEAGQFGSASRDGDEKSYQEDMRDREDEEEEYDWATDPQNLIDAVSGQMRAAGDGSGVCEGMEGITQERQEDEPSADTGLGREGMGQVFGLESVEGEEGHA